MAWTRFGKKKDMPGGLWIKCESCGRHAVPQGVQNRHPFTFVCGLVRSTFTLPLRLEAHRDELV
jgi:hypothetical protein